MPDDERSTAKPPPGWDERALRDPHRQFDKAGRVQAMFNAIAGTYERINTLATFGRDAVWRRRAVEAARVQPGDVILDVACGTGDMIRAFGEVRSQKPVPGRIIGVDFAREMLARGDYSRVAVPVELVEADALDMPLPDESVDVISCAFGVRNFQDLQAGLVEMYRVARAGARVVILEFAMPGNRLLRWLNERYCKFVLPCLGALVARDRVGAYRYLPRSVKVFEPVESMVLRMRDAGFVNVTTRAMNLGGVVLYRGEKPASGGPVQVGRRGEASRATGRSEEESAE
jgi:demethylmenaquinone methyltransferase/2-methoxy-6-polyprenyl-1,4-benzoquinol methylase